MSPPRRCPTCVWTGGPAASKRSSTGAASAPEPVPELLHLGEEAFALGGGAAVLVGLRFELLQEFALAARQVLRRFHRHLHVHVAAGGAAQHGEALAAQTELVARLRAGRDR